MTSSYRPFSEVEDTYDHSAQIKVINDILENKDTEDSASKSIFAEKHKAWKDLIISQTV